MVEASMVDELEKYWERMGVGFYWRAGFPNVAVRNECE